MKIWSGRVVVSDLAGEMEGFLVSQGRLLLRSLYVYISVVMGDKRQEAWGWGLSCRRLDRLVGSEVWGNLTSLN